MLKPDDKSSADDCATLYLNDKRVGTVVPRGMSASWSWGEFTADAGFAEFAPLFGVWSLMMHADDGNKRLSREAADELRQAEVALDALHAKLHFPDQNRWMPIGELNIDATLIEWKHG